MPGALLLSGKFPEGVGDWSHRAPVFSFSGRLSYGGVTVGARGRAPPAAGEGPPSPPPPQTRGGSASPSCAGPPTVQAGTGGALPGFRPRGQRAGPQGLTPPGSAPHPLALGIWVDSVRTPMPCTVPHCPSQRGGLFMSGAGSVVPSSGRCRVRRVTGRTREPEGGQEVRSKNPTHPCWL